MTKLETKNKTKEKKKLASKKENHLLTDIIDF